MMREGEIRTRFLWKKDLTTKSNYISETRSEKIEINAPLSDLITQINNTISTIKTKGEQPKLVAKYFYLLGRISFVEKNYEKAIDAFGKSNMVITKAGLPENHEIFYWYARMREIENKIADAKMYYGFALENYTGDPNLISREEIQKALDKL